MASQGPNLVTVVEQSGLGGTWVNPTNITADDGSYAAVSLEGTFSKKLIGRSLGFTIPATATINGIIVDVERQQDGIQAGDVQDSTVQLQDDTATLVGNNKATNTSFVASPSWEVKTYGNSTDTWGWAGVTPTKINHANFGVVLIVNETFVQPQDGRIDYVKITVHYTEAAGGAGKQTMLLGVG